MPVGLEITNDTGSIQIDQNYFNMQFIMKGSCTLNTRVSDVVDPSANSSMRSQVTSAWCNTNGVGHPSTGLGQLIAFRPRFSDRPVGIAYTSYGTWQFVGYTSVANPAPTGSYPVVDWWMFARANSTPSGVGLEVFDENGNITFTSGALPMKIAAVKNDIPLNSGDTSITATTGDYAICVGTPFPYVVDYQYDGQWDILEYAAMWSGATSTGFAAPQLRAAMVRANINNTPAVRATPYATLMLVNIAGLGDTPPDRSLDAINWGNISWSTNAQSGSGSNSIPAPISGINEPVTIRATVSGYTGSVSSGTLKIMRMVLGSPVEQSAASISGNGQFVETTVSAGDQIYFQYEASTANLRKDVSFTVSVTNTSNGSVLVDTFTVTATVDADNNYVGPDTTMDAANWANISGSTNSNTVTTSNAAQGITGINAAINLRATISGYSGNLTSGYLQMFVNGSSVGTTGTMTSGAFIGSNVSSGDQVYFTAYADTASGLRTGSYTVTVQNMTTGDTIDTFTVGLTVDADDNYNNSGDYTPNALNWANISANTTDNSGFAYGSNSQTVTGIDQTVSLRLSLTSTYINVYSLNFGGSGSMYVSVKVDGVSVAETAYDTFLGSQTFEDRQLDFTVTNNDVVAVDVNFYISGTGEVSGDGGASCTIQNLSTGGTALDTFTISASATYDDGLG